LFHIVSSITLSDTLDRYSRLKVHNYIYYTGMLFCQWEPESLKSCLTAAKKFTLSQDIEISDQQ